MKGASGECDQSTRRGMSSWISVAAGSLRGVPSVCRSLPRATRGQEFRGPAGRAVFQWPHGDLWGSCCHSCLPPRVPRGFLKNWPLLRVGNPMAMGGVNENMAESRTLSGPSSSFLQFARKNAAWRAPNHPALLISFEWGKKMPHFKVITAHSLGITLLLGFRYFQDTHEMLTPQRGQNGRVGDGCITETWPRLSPGVGPNLLLLDLVSSWGSSSHQLELCADTSLHSSLCVFFHTGLSTSFHRPVSCHSSLPCSDIATLSPGLLCPSPVPATQHGHISCLKGVWWGHASCQSTGGCPQSWHSELCRHLSPVRHPPSPTLACLLTRVPTHSG